MCFVAVNAWGILMLHTWATVPFHFIWIGVSLRYGWRVWNTEVTAVSLAVIVDASHVLRTPLTSALGHAVLLQRSFRDPDAVGDAQVVDEPSGPPVHDLIEASQLAEPRTPDLR